MGATNDIRGTNITLKLTDKNCSQCSFPFTQLDIDEKNFDPWWDNSDDVILEPIGQWYKLSILIRSIEHKWCPEIEYCNHCDDRLLVDKFKEQEGNYYCLPCYQNHYAK